MRNTLILLEPIKVKTWVHFFRKNGKEKIEKGRNMRIFGQKYTKLEKIERYLHAITVHKKLLE